MAGGVVATTAGFVAAFGAALVAGAVLANASGLVHNKARVKVRQQECSERMFIPQSSRATTMDSDAYGQAVRQRQTVGAPSRDEPNDGTGGDDTAEHGPFQCCWRTEGKY